MFGVIQAILTQKEIEQRAAKIERSRAQARINLDNYLDGYCRIAQETAKIKQELFWDGVLGNNVPTSASKCDCCGSLDFVKHHNNIICSYCRTPKYIR